MPRLINNTSTTSKRSLWPPHTHNLWVEGAHGSQLTLSNGLTYDDWASALGANTLGYNAFGNLLHVYEPSVSLPWRYERELAESFCEVMDVDAVRFFKNGSDALSCAVRLARAYTNRNTVIVFDKCYHGTGDWHGVNLWSTQGITPTTHTLVLPFGEIVNVTTPQNVAAIVVEPVPKAIDIPDTTWLLQLQDYCHTHNIMLISDEVILGYRHTLTGYATSVGLSPDIRCYGKAMGQGTSIAACAGSFDIMKLLAQDVHYSNTNNGEPLPLRIAQLTLNEYRKRHVCAELDARGQHLRRMLGGAGFTTRGLNTRFEIELGDKASAIDYCFTQGVLFPSFCSIALTHTQSMMCNLVDTLSVWRDNERKHTAYTY